ncbi:WxL domain-containing protein [Levilactobacillus wangkuiensis]|uniref:WxL domain-containing protein n=1 Tax=Levilactobacillus wangkuiensis TaxID=2799566 RepID=UPI0019406FE2|nr:WxL domain-containing protein [Levilactobacillus wangkuiensis]
MFKKTLGFVAVAAALTGLGLASTTTANADVAAGATTGTTAANVNLTADPNGAGGVSLVQVPTLTFGDKVLTGSKDTTTLGVANNLVVKNAGANTGWSVTVDGTAMTSGDDKLAGGSYDLKSASEKALAVQSDFTTEDTSNDTTATVSAATDSVTGDNFNGVAINTGVATSAQSVMNAAAKQGIGTFSANFGKDSVLNIPASAVAGKYESTLTWTLKNAPLA